jgi:hypothetical protein
MGVKDARTRLAGTVMLSTVVFFVVSLLVSLGVLWWTGDVARGILIGVICGSAAALTVGTVVTAIGPSRDRSSNEHKRSRAGHDR